MKRIALATVGFCALVLPAAGQAQISLHPNTLPAASHPMVAVRVPNVEARASTVKVDMQIPPGFASIATELPAGWRAQKLTRKVAQPIRTSSGPVSEEVAEIIWTASRGGGIPPGSFVQFPMLATIPGNAAGRTLTFKVIQTYSNGDIVHWVEAPTSATHPAPTVNVTKQGGVVQDVAGTEAGPGRPLAPVATPSLRPPKVAVPKGATKALGIAALALAALGLLAGLAALVTVRRRSPLRS